MTKNKTIRRILCLFTTFIVAQSLGAFDHSHELWTDVLQTYNIDGKVNYKGLKANPATFNKYLGQLENVTSSEVANWTKNQQLAYWINAYNAYTIKSIVDNYPTKSIKKISGVWKKRKHQAGGVKITLDDIEHKKLRAELKEPRIHFAVNCASIGCPKLLNEAFEATKLDEQFKTGVEAMLNNRGQFRIDQQKSELHLSKILDWFRKDFDAFTGVSNYGKNNGVVSFLIEYLPESKRNLITSKKLKVKWIDYDWNLNEG